MSKDKSESWLFTGTLTIEKWLEEYDPDEQVWDCHLDGEPLGMLLERTGLASEKVEIIVRKRGRG